jgi:outer membrane lipoprotein-sorting protein
MNSKTKSASLFLITAILVSAFAACRQAEVSEPERSIPSKDPLPFAWSEISKRYETVKDYTAVYEKEERSISKGEKQIIKLSFRKPFDIRMEWLTDKGKVDETVIYQEGKNDGKILTKEGGLLGSVLGTVEISPDSAIARENSKYPITKVGLGNLVERITAEANDPQTETNFVGEEKLADGRVAYKIEMGNPAGPNMTGAAEERNSLIYIDKELLLPVKVEIYDASGVLYERHVFRNLRLNVNLSDKTFEM